MADSISDSALKIREKRRWQTAYRRYVINKMPNEDYAPYFGLDVEALRGWFELQFTDTINWETFGKYWQFDHIVPVAYFNYAIEEDLRLCWNFINIRVEKIELNKARGNRIDVMAVRPYFQEMFNKTGFSLYNKMLKKIKEIEVSNIESHQNLEDYIITNKQHLENIASLSNYEFNRLNQGMSLEDILLERQIFERFK